MNNFSMILHKYVLVKEIFTDKRLAFVLIFGMVSGMAVSILYTTLAAWMMDKNFGLTAIGVFALARFPYAFKFSWANFIDRYHFPILGFLGKRRSWMIGANISLITSFLLIDYLCDHFSCAFFLAICFGFSAATFDIAYEAYRIEILDDESYPVGIATSVFGYRMGLLLTGAGSLYLSSLYNWNISFLYTALFLSIGTIAALWSDEPKVKFKKNLSFESTLKSLMLLKNSFLILSMIAFYRVGEAMLGTMLTPFFLDIGFSKSEIATIAKIFGLVATLIGAYFGSILVRKFGYIKALLICSIPQMLSNLSFVVLNHIGHDITSLTIAVAIEDFSAGMGTTAIVAYLCSLCNERNAATKFALLSALAAAANNTVPFISGKIAESFGWDIFFLTSTLIALPGVVFSYMLCKSYKNT